jgi:hypothetical protein
MTTDSAQQPRATIRPTINNIAKDCAELAREAGRVSVEGLKQPTSIAALAGAVAMGAVLTIGLVQTAIGGTVAYLGYRLVRRRKHAHDEPSGA